MVFFYVKCFVFVPDLGIVLYIYYYPETDNIYITFLYLHIRFTKWEKVTNIKINEPIEYKGLKKIHFPD